MEPTLGLQADAVSGYFLRNTGDTKTATSDQTKSATPLMSP